MFWYVEEETYNDVGLYPDLPEISIHALQAGGYQLDSRKMAHCAEYFWNTERLARIFFFLSYSFLQHDSFSFLSKVLHFRLYSDTDGSTVFPEYDDIDIQFLFHRVSCAFSLIIGCL